MGISRRGMCEQSKEFDYLRVDWFIRDFVNAKALATALELYLIDYLRENQPITFDSLRREFKGDSQAL
jgi:hypothetical protein